MGCELFTSPCENKAGSHYAGAFKAVRQTCRNRRGLLAVCEVRSEEVKGQILAETLLMSPFIKHQVITAVLNMFRPDVVVEMFEMTARMSPPTTVKNHSLHLLMRLLSLSKKQPYKV